MRSSRVWRLAGIVLLAGMAFASACNDSPLSGPQALGRLDPTRVMAVGDGYLAGVTDGALFITGQAVSVPALFVQQAAPGAEFLQPLVADPGIALDDPTAGRITLVRPRPLELARLASGEPITSGPNRPYDNLGVPGALLGEALTARSSATSLFGNPFYDLVLRDRGTFADQVAEREATMVLLWLGTSDVLTYVARGGDPALAPGLPTPPVNFESSYTTLVDQLLEVTDQVVLFTIPDVTRFPILTAVPNLVIHPVTGDTVLVTVTEIDSVTGLPIGGRQVPVPLLGPAGQLGGADRVTLDALPLVQQGMGIPRELGGAGTPLPNRAILDADEISLARDAVASYNEAILRIAEERDLAVVDVHALVEQLASDGVLSDGILLTNEWLRGQAFSLDGAYFTPKGYGVVTNLLIDAVNARYGSRLRPVRTSALRGIPLLSVATER
ncbi:MAG: hypothetical protein ABR527_06865 [Gemmatimonadota bacterium]